MTSLRVFSIAACLALAVAIAPAARAQTPPAPPPAASEQPSARDDRDAVDAGLKWLALVDADKAGAAWDDAAKHLKSAVTRAKFVAAMRALRKPLGKLSARTPVRFGRSHQMPGAPDGDYAIVEYEAKFAGGRLSEVVVWTLEDGDIWRVAGYEYR